MVSFTQQQTIFGDLSQNSSSTNLTRGAYLANIEQKYLLQKYFANEGSYSITTVGSQSLTSTGSFAIGATSGTLSSAWMYWTVQAQVTFSSGEYRSVQFTAGSTAISWSGALTSTATTALSVGGVQFYPFPPNYSKLKTITLTIGNLKWTLNETRTREDWDRLNVFPYYADIPNNYFIYPGGDRSGQVGIWPIPSTTGNVITFNYKFRVPDLSVADVVNDHTVSVANGSTTVTGAATTWTVTQNPQLESRWIQFSPTSSSATTGDNLWYQIASVNSATSITLYQPYQGTSITSSSTYTIGQMPIIAEDFQDMLVWKALVYYFSSIVDNPKKAQEFKDFYNEKLALLSEYSGSNSINVNLSPKRNAKNPNSYPYSLTG